MAIDLGSASGVPKDATAVAGGQKYIFVSDIAKVFNEILVELKLMNAQLSLLTGEHITDDELKEDIT